MRKTDLLAATAGVVAFATASAFGIGYASGVTDLGGGDYSFVLNQDATNVTVLMDGGSTQDFGALAAGTHTFNAPAGFQVQVSSTTAGTGYSQISTDNMSNSIKSPYGLAVNRNTTSSDFGSVFIGNSAVGDTIHGRTMAPGIYKLNAAGAENGSITNMGWSGMSSSSFNAVFKIQVAQDDNLYVSNYYNDTLYQLDTALTTNTAILGPSLGNLESGQWVASMWVDGSQAAGNRKIYTVDSNFNSALPGSPTSVKVYDLGSDATATGFGTTMIDRSEFSTYPYDLVRDSAGNFYAVEYRANVDFGPIPNLRKFDAAGSQIYESGMPYDTGYAYGVYALDLHEESGLVALAGNGRNLFDGDVRLFDMNTGAFVGTFDSGLSNNSDVAFDAAGNVYVVDWQDDRMRVFSPTGSFVTTLGSDGAFSVVPEPASLLTLALGGLLVSRRRRAA